MVSDEEWGEEVNSWLDDERFNLDKEVDGVIIAFGDLGLWRRAQAGAIRFWAATSRTYCIALAKIANGTATAITSVDAMAHHDGTNYVLYRVAKSREDAERIADKIYNLEIDEAGFRKLTRSLYPYVADIYGWKVRGR